MSDVLGGLMRTIVTIFLPTLTLAASLSAADPTVLADLVDPAAMVEKLGSGCKWAEGPVWLDWDGGFLVFSDIPNNRMFKWTQAEGMTIWRARASYANGNMQDRQGRLVTCEQGGRRVAVTTPDGTTTPLVESYNGKRFTAPNDIVEKTDRTLWFTDPAYNPKKVVSEMAGNWVYRHDPASGVTTVVSKDFDMPNGLCFAPEEKVLYISDTGKPRHIRAYGVQADGSLAEGRVFVTFEKGWGLPDGMRCDERGNLWASAGDGVRIFAPDGRFIGHIPCPEKCANLCWGGADRRTVFLTSTTSLYRIPVKVGPAVR